MATNTTKKIQSPGFILKQELKSHKITQKSLASMMDIQQSHLSEIIKGKRSITPPIAEKLEKFFNHSASYWIRIQAKYDFECVVQKLNDSEENKSEESLMEYNELYDMKLLCKKLGLDKKPASERLAFCNNSLHFESVAVQRKTILGYFHKSEKTGLDKRMIATWSVLAIYEASQLQEPVNRFNRTTCDDLAYELCDIFNENQNTINRVTRTLYTYGVKFCIVEKVPHASIDGFSFYIDGVPCIVVTKRFNRIDNFAFAILHEVGHLKMHLHKNSIGKVNVVDPDMEQLAKEEMEANNFAANALIPETIWSKQPPVKLNNPRAIQKIFTKFALDNHKNKWIVLGRLSHETNIFMFTSDSSREIH